MQKKINETVREHLRMLCYEVVLGEQIDQITMDCARDVVRTYLNSNGYKIDSVKCDQENNPSDIIDSNKMQVNIVEQGGPNSYDKIIHTIIL